MQGQREVILNLKPNRILLRDCWVVVSLAKTLPIPSLTANRVSPDWGETWGRASASFIFSSMIMPYHALPVLSPPGQRLPDCLSACGLVPQGTKLPFFLGKAPTLPEFSRRLRVQRREGRRGEEGKKSAEAA